MSPSLCLGLLTTTEVIFVYSVLRGLPTLGLFLAMRLTLFALFAVILVSPTVLSATNLKISHQFPGGTLEAGDFRDRLCRKFAAALEARTQGALTATVYPGSSLMKVNAQFSAMRKGALDLTLLPIANAAGGEVPEVNIGLMPGLVTSYEQGMAWKNAPIGREFSALLAEKGVIIVSWIWQAGGVASRNKAILEPADAKGLKIRGGSREMDLALKAAGAAVVSLPSNEIYAGLQTGAIDAALTSSTSLISFHLEENAKHLTTGRGHAYWFMFEPLMISKTIFEALPKDQQQLILSVGTELEAFAIEAAKADDQKVAEVYAQAGANVYDLSAQTVSRWREIARGTSWKDYAAKGPRFAKLIQLAEAVP